MIYAGALSCNKNQFLFSWKSGLVHWIFWKKNHSPLLNKMGIYGFFFWNKFSLTHL
jgi:hypothetical protein